MAYKTYGEAFKEIRIHKEMSLGNSNILVESLNQPSRNLKTGN